MVPSIASKARRTEAKTFSNKGKPSKAKLCKARPCKAHLGTTKVGEDKPREADCNDKLRKAKLIHVKSS